MRHVHIMPRPGPRLCCSCSLCPRQPLAGAIPETYTLRFSDVPATATLSQPLSGAPQAPANIWPTSSTGNRWPPSLFGAQQRLFFAGPPAQRYLRVYADKTFYILARQLELDPQALPWLSITWGVERFPLTRRWISTVATTAPSRHGVVWRPHSASGLLPSVPRPWRFLGKPSRLARCTRVSRHVRPSDIRLQCKYPHVKYIALRHGEAGSIHTDQVNLLEHFQAHFADYWQEHHRVPQVVAVSIEASSRKTQSISSARLYSLSFSAVAETSDGPVVQTR